MIIAPYNELKTRAARAFSEALFDLHTQHFRMFHRQRHSSRRQHNAWVSKNKGCLFAVIGTEKEYKGCPFVGFCTIPFDHHGVARISYGVFNKYVGRGVGTNILREVASLCFGVGIHRVEGEVLSKNPASIRCFEKAGFTLEGIRRKAVRTQTGLVDSLMFGKLAPEKT